MARVDAGDRGTIQVLSWHTNSRCVALITHKNYIAVKKAWLRQLVIMPTAQYRYINQAYSPRDGGCVQFLQYFKSEQKAEQAIAFFMPLISAHADYENIRVTKTIVVFHPELLGR